MDSRKECKGCSSSVRLSEEDIYDIIKNIKVDKDRDIVCEKTYKERIGVCKKCEDLLYNTTCRYSGYLVYVKAREQKAFCPRPGQTNW